MAEDFKLPNQKSVVFWPIGTGDSTTLLLQPGKIAVQIDLRHLEKADDAEEPEWPILDHLVKALPKRNGRPYLAVFVLTHPDKDHIQGFQELLKKVEIGELWHTPKIFRDNEDDDEVLCEDAKAFRKEAHRRRDVIAADPSNIKSGNRLRVIGHDDILNEPEYKKLPDECKSRPGEKVTVVDGINLAGEFEAFIHAPFKADMASNKNNTSLSLNVSLIEGEFRAQFFFFGDREYPTISQIFEETESGGNSEYLHWDVMLSSHHCSKSVMYWKGEEDKEESLRQDIMDKFEEYARQGAYVVSSSHSDFTDGDGHNPPHLRARKRYEEIVDSGRFICTHEFPNKKTPVPVVFEVTTNGLQFTDLRNAAKAAASLSAAAAGARGSSQPPNVQVGFGVRS